MPNGRKGMAVLLALCLLLGAAHARAAVTRDMQAVEITMDDRLQTLVNILWAAMPEEAFGDTAVTVLEKDAAPGADLAELALWAAALFTRESDVMALDEARALYGQIFTNGEYALDNPHTFLTETEAGLRVNWEDMPLCPGGAHIYSAAFDGADAVFLCDGFAYEWLPGDEDVSVDEAPEEAVRWVCGMELSLRFAPETAFGYTVNSIALTPLYRDGNLGGWIEEENTVYEYSVNLPGSLGLADGDPAHRVWQNAEGDVTVTVDVAEESLSFDMALSRFMQEHPGQKVSQEREFDFFCALGEGWFALCVVSEELPWVYSLTMDFPPERQAEYAFYAEIIRNSFGAWGISNG